MKKEYRQRLELLLKENSYKTIELFWMDACSTSYRYRKDEELGTPGSIVKTVGLLIEESDDFYRLAQCTCECSVAWHPIDIPKAWVLRKRVLK